MRVEALQLIVDALRSGTYTQCFGAMHDGKQGSCVQGVIHEVVRDALGLPPYTESGLRTILSNTQLELWLGTTCSILNVTFTMDDFKRYAPRLAFKQPTIRFLWDDYLITVQEQCRQEGCVEVMLPFLNDAYQLSFAEIADLLVKEYWPVPEVQAADAIPSTPDLVAV